MNIDLQTRWPFGAWIRVESVPVLMQETILDSEDIEKYSVITDLHTNDHVPAGYVLHLDGAVGIEVVRNGIFRRIGRTHDVRKEVLQSVAPISSHWIVLDVTLLNDDLINHAPRFLPGTVEGVEKFLDYLYVLFGTVEMSILTHGISDFLFFECVQRSQNSVLKDAFGRFHDETLTVDEAPAKCELFHGAHSRCGFNSAQPVGP
ncbi:hypothetical protein H351_30780 (plasmid) [Rhodococcus erythropolis R138]|nr:hypothetical protein H351_30780 [Rhodococcus erythropolis R138]